MFYVFHLRPDARQEVLLGALLRSGAYFLSVILVAAWMYFMEYEAFEDKLILLLAICSFFTVVAVMVGVRHYKLGRDFRLFSNEEGFEFTTPGAEVKLAYGDITRVVRTRTNVLMIYTNSSATKPVVMISDRIADRDVLESILTKYVPITEGQGLPVLFGTAIQIGMSALFIVTILLHLLSTNVITVVVSGSLVVGLLIYMAVVMYIFQKEVKNVRALIALVLLILVAVTRMILFLSSDQL